MRRKTWFIVSAALLLLMLAACGGNKTNDTPSNQTPTGESSQTAGKIDAETVYKQNCLGCHAADLSGGVGPNLQKVGGNLNQEQIHDKIANGGGGMPPFKKNLDDAEITALTEWLASHK